MNNSKNNTGESPFSQSFGGKISYSSSKQQGTKYKGAGIAVQAAPMGSSPLQLFGSNNGASSGTKAKIQIASVGQGFSQPLSFGAGPPLSFIGGPGPQLSGKKMQEIPIAVVDAPQKGPQPQPKQETKEEAIVFVASKLHSSMQSNAGIVQQTPAIYSEYTSRVVDDQPESVLDKFAEVLAAYSDDMSFKVDRKQFKIDGVLYVKHCAVFFCISVWKEEAALDDNSNSNHNNQKKGAQKRTRFEFRRSSGDPLGFQQFWQDMLDRSSKMFSNISGKAIADITFGFGSLGGASEEEEEVEDAAEESSSSFDMAGLGGMQAFGGLDYNMAGLELSDLDMDMAGMDDEEDDAGSGEEKQESSKSGALKASDYSKSELDNFVKDINTRDITVVASLAAFIDSASLQQAKTVELVLSHGDFMQALINGALNQSDEALVRASLLILQSVSKSPKNADAVIGNKALDNLLNLVNHESELIRKYAVRTLWKLSSSNCKWNVENEKQKSVSSKLNELQSQWSKSRFATDDFIKNDMFKCINTKLITASS